jgi:hypothetical protein
MTGCYTITTALNSLFVPHAPCGLFFVVLEKTREEEYQNHSFSLASVQSGISYEGEIRE